jgi:hypothetical protein
MHTDLQKIIGQLYVCQNVWAVMTHGYLPTYTKKRSFETIPFSAKINLSVSRIFITLWHTWEGYNYVLHI